MMYPGTALRRFDSRFDLVKFVQERLVGVKVDGIFGPVTESAVKLFQTQHGLEADGIIGPRTWAALFGGEPATALVPSDPLIINVLRIAREQIGVREVGGPNRGPEVEKYLARVGLVPGFPWCAALVYFCFDEAALRTVVPNPLPKTAGVLDHWNRAADKFKLPPNVPFDDLRNLNPGSIFCIDHGNGHGHTGIVVLADREGLKTIEGNTNVAGSREGDGVYYRTRRLEEITLGYLDYSRT